MGGQARTALWWAVVGVVLTAPGSFALAVDQTYTWTPAANQGNSYWWDGTSNWGVNGRSPGVGDTAIFQNPTTGTLSNVAPMVAKRANTTAAIGNLTFLDRTDWLIQPYQTDPDGLTLTGSTADPLPTINVGTNAAATLSVVVNGSNGFEKTGAGTLTLSGANTYTGATAINSGTLSLTSTGSIASGSSTTVASGATITGSGTVNGPLTVSSGGAIAGNLIAKGATSLEGNGSYVASLTTVGGVGGTPAVPTGTAGGSSQLNLAGASSVTISDSFKINITGAPGSFTTPGIYNWLVMAVSNVGALNWDGIQIGTVSFGSPSDFSVFAVDGSSDYIGVSYSYSAVPEATTLLLGFAGLTPVLLQRRSQRRFQRSGLAV